MTGCFITATGTGVGKTLLTTLLLRLRLREGLSVHALKPVETGEPIDSAAILSAMGMPVSPEARQHITAYHFLNPISPHLAAQMAGLIIEPEALLSFCRMALSSHPFTIIEGVGGVMVPVTPDWTVREWMRALGLPVILVGGSELGAISHTLTALETLRVAGISPCGIAVMAAEQMPIAPEEHLTTLAAFTDVPLTFIPRLDLCHGSPHDKNTHLDAALSALPHFSDWVKECGAL